MNKKEHRREDLQLTQCRVDILEQGQANMLRQLGSLVGTLEALRTDLLASKVNDVVEPKVVEMLPPLPPVRPVHPEITVCGRRVTWGWERRPALAPDISRAKVIEGLLPLVQTLEPGEVLSVALLANETGASTIPMQGTIRKGLDGYDWVVRSSLVSGWLELWKELAPTERRVEVTSDGVEVRVKAQP